MALGAGSRNKVDSQKLMSKTIRVLIAALFLGLAHAAAQAQPAPQPAANPQGPPAPPKAAAPAQPVPAKKSQVQKSEAQEHLDQSVQELAEKIADIERRVDVTHPTPGSLAILADRLMPLVPQAQALVDRLTPRVTAFKARLDQLGKPDADESQAVRDDRTTLEKQFSENDGLLKRAKALAVKAQQDATYIAKRQRTLFTNSLFQRSTSILSPMLWGNVVKEMPENVSDAARALRSWVDDFNNTLTGGKRFVFWVLVAFLVLLYWPLTRAAKRIVVREVKVETPNAWQKILVASWTAVSVAALTILTMYGVVYALSFFLPPDARLMPLFSALQEGVIRIAVASALGRALLAPFRPKWRVLDLDDVVAGRLMRLVVGVTTIIAVVKIFEALNDVIYASLDFTAATRGIGSCLVALTLAAGLVGLRSSPEADGEEATAVARPETYSFGGILRGLAWVLLVVISVAVVVGFIPFASFLSEQLIRVAAVGGILYLATRFVDEACAVGLEPKSRLGRNLIYTVGLRRETLQQIAVILSGVARLALIAAAVLLVVTPWGMQSSDLAGNVNAIVFGFKVGDTTISLAGIAFALLSFGLVLAASHVLQRWLEDRYLPTTRLDPGLRNSIKTSLGYIGFIVALAVGAADLGLDFQKLAIVAGALSVGIGFGLQSIVNNFVSGLILLWERAVRVGDWVVVGADQGYVRKINVRSTEIETFDRTAVIVPNSNLVTGIVKNLMRNDRMGRINIDLTVHATSDPEKVREVLLDIARDNEAIVTLPSPQVRFTDLNATAMHFSLFCFVSDVEDMAKAKSDLYFEICRQFRQYKFFDGPAPDPTRISFVDMDRLEELVAASRSRVDRDAALSRKTA